MLIKASDKVFWGLTGFLFFYADLSIENNLFKLLAGYFKCVRFILHVSCKLHLVKCFCYFTEFWYKI